MTGNPATFLLFALGGLMLATEGRPTRSAEVPPRPLAEWVQTDPPRPGDDRHQAANHDSDHTWAVAIRDGRAVATVDNKPPIPPRLPFALTDPTTEFRFSGRQVAIRVDDGWIAAFDKGEWGGTVWWFAPDGTDRYQIAEGNVVGFVPTRHGLLMMEGLAHMSLNRGRLLELARNPAGHWAARPVADLGCAPRAAALRGDDDLIVVGFDRLLRVELPTRRVETLVRDAFWQSFYPTSIVVDASGAAWIGMRHGVARLDRLGLDPAIRWCTPDRATAEARLESKPGFP